MTEVNLHIDRDENGRVIAEYQMLEDTIDGRYVSYDEEGNLQSKLCFKEGQLNGICRFYEAGRLLQVARFCEGKMHGRALSYENGHLATYSLYKNGKLHGPMFSFYETRKTKSIMRYELGILSGISSYFDSAGNKISEANYKDGNLHGESILYYPDGRILKRERYEHGKLLEVLNE